MGEWPKRLEIRMGEWPKRLENRMGEWLKGSRTGRGSSLAFSNETTFCYHDKAIVNQMGNTCLKMLKIPNSRFLISSTPVTSLQ